MKKQVKKGLIIFSSLIGIAAIATTAIVTPIELTHKQSNSTTIAVANTSSASNPAVNGVSANKVKTNSTSSAVNQQTQATPTASSTTPTTNSTVSSQPASTTTSSSTSTTSSSSTTSATSSTQSATPTPASSLSPVATSSTTASNISNAYLSQLDNYLMQKNSFTSSQIDQMNNIIDNTDFVNNDASGSNLLANTNANADQVNATMRTLAKDFVANMQTNGLQRNAVQTFLTSKNVPASWVAKHTTINNLTIEASSKLITLLSVLYKLDQNNASNLVENLNGFINEELPTYFSIYEKDGTQLSSIFFTDVIKSVQLVSIANDTYQFSIWTKPNITLLNNENSLYHNGEATGTQLTLNVAVNQSAENVNTIAYSFTNNLTTLIRKAQAEINYGSTTGLAKIQLIGTLINQAMSNNPSQYLTISVNGYALPSWTYKYFLTANNAITINSVNNDIYTMQVSFPTSLSFWKVQDQMIYAGNDCNYVLINYTLNTNSNDATTIKLNLVNEEAALKAEISLYSSQLSNYQNQMNNTTSWVTMYQDRINIWNTKRNIAWDYATYVSDNLGTNSSAGKQAMSEWYDLNNAYWGIYNRSTATTSNFEDGGFLDALNDSALTNFQNDYNTIAQYYNTDVNPGQTQLVLINDAKQATTKLPTEEKDLAIASTVASGVSVALAAAYWAGTFFFGITTASAIAATAAAVSCIATTATMWKQYDDTLQLSGEVGVSYQKTLKSIKSTEYDLGLRNLPGALRTTWSDFKDLFNSKIGSILTATRASVGAQAAVVGACSWADEALLALSALDSALCLAISVATIAVNAVNTNWLNTIYNTVKGSL